MPGYRIELLDASRTRVAVLDNLLEASVTEEINRQHTMRIVVSEDDDKVALIKTRKYHLRWVELDNPTTRFATFRIAQVAPVQDDERETLEVTATHILYNTTREIYAVSTTFTEVDIDSLVTDILSYSAWAKGTISSPTATTPTITFQYPTVMEALQQVCEAWGREMQLDETAATPEVDLLAELGADNNVQFRYGRNLTSARCTEDVEKVINRVFALGGGDPPLLIGRVNGSVDYVEDATSQSEHGVQAGRYENRSLEDVANLVATPFFDGTYTAGLCADWTKVGAPTVTEETGTGNFTYGTKSQKIVAGSANLGVSQAVTVVADTEYSAKVYVKVDSGSVLVTIVAADGTWKYPATTETGWLQIEIECWTPQTTTATISVLSSGGAATFYVDAVQVTVGASNADAWVDGDNATVLMAEANTYLTDNKDAPKLYEIGVVDLYGGNPAKYPDDRVSLGDTVRVVADRIGVDASVRIVSKRWNPLDPWELAVDVE